MNFLLVCTGTAGHINPALAIAAELQKRVPGAEILFVGADRELEKKLIPAAGYDLKNIRMSGLRRKLTPENVIFNLKTVKNLSVAGIKARKIIDEFRPTAVIGTGGYICYPVLKKAAQMGIPTVIHGSDAAPGLTTRMLGATVDKVLVSFPGLEHLYKRPNRVIFTGTPVREGFAVSDSYRDKVGLPLVVSFWGSLGARHMNEAMAAFIKCNASGLKFRHIHATGKSGGPDELLGKLRGLGFEGKLPDGIEIREYIEDMPSVMPEADLVLSRAGASTIAELTLMGKPAILVPSPYVTNNHQEENAKQLVKAGGAVMLHEKTCTGEGLFDTVTKLLADKEKLKAMSQAQKSISPPNATEKIVDIILELCT